MFNFWNFIRGLRPKFRPQIPQKIFFCPIFDPKTFWVKSDHYIILKSQKSYPLEMTYVLGGVRNLYVTYPNNVLNC